MLLNSQRWSFDERISEFHNENLNYDGENFYRKEEPIIEESLEHIIFILFEFSAVDFIEDLKEHENLEKQSVMNSFFNIPNAQIISKARWDIKKNRSFEQNNCEDDDLEDSLSEDISPHVRGDDWFISGIRRSIQ